MAAPKKSGLSKLGLYPELLPSTGTISGAPVKYGAEGAVTADAGQPAKKPKDAALQFLPTRRPQAQISAKPKPAFSSSSSSSLPGPKPSMGTSTSAPSDSTQSTAVTSSFNQSSVRSMPPPKLGQKRPGFEDWVAGEDEEEYYMNQPKAPRKKKKKNNQQQRAPIWSWVDMFDITFGTDIDTYPQAEERLDSRAAWKRRIKSTKEKESRRQVPAASSGSVHARGQEHSTHTHGQPPRFAPPDGLNFAPAAGNNGNGSQPTSFPSSGQPSTGLAPPRHGSGPSPAAAPTLNDSGEDAYTRRMRMGEASPPTPVNANQANSSEMDAKKAEVIKKIAAMKAKFQAQAGKLTADSASRTGPPEAPPPPPPPPEPKLAVEPRSINQSAGLISRAPVRYEATDSTSASASATAHAQPPPTHEEAPTPAYSNKEGFGRRYMQSLGWDATKGLGAQEQGITSAIKVVPEKRKKRPDAEGGGFVNAANMGKIVGGKTRKVDGEKDPSQNVSLVIKLEGMLDGLDIDHEVQNNNLQQEIGDDMNNNYGTVERLFIWKMSNGGHNEVFVKFTSQASAVRAVNGMDDTTFADNKITASFWDADKFEKGEYE